jgi:hypothetical protein
MPEAAAWAAKRVAGDVVPCVLEVGHVLMCLGLHEMALAKPHVAPD